MSRKHNVSHNACSVYDYCTFRWKVQPADIVAFDVRDGQDDDYQLGEVILLTRDLIHIRRLKDGFIYVISLYDIRDYGVTPVDTARRLPSGIFFVGDRVLLDGELNLPDEKFIIDSFDTDLHRVKIHYFSKGRSVGCYFVRECEILKYIEE